MGDLLADVKSETSRYLKALYIEALTKKDQHGSPESDAHKLYIAGQGREMGTLENVFAEVFGRAGPEHLNLVKMVYERKYHVTLEKAVKSELGMFEAQLKRACLNAVRGHGAFLAKQLIKACKGLGTDDTMLQ